MLAFASGKAFGGVSQVQYLADYASGRYPYSSLPGDLSSFGIQKYQFCRSRRRLLSP
jgi:hypothetical protein